MLNLMFIIADKGQRTNLLCYVIYYAVASRNYTRWFKLVVGLSY